MCLSEMLDNDVIQVYFSPGSSFPDVNGNYCSTTYDVKGLIVETSCGSWEEFFDKPSEAVEVIHSHLKWRVREMKKSLAKDRMKNKKKRPKKGCVYLMVNDRNGYTKIGFTTKTPEYRESTLQSQEPEVRLINSFKGTMDDEQDLHTIFGEKRVRGEWFELDSSDIKTVEGYFEGESHE